MDDEGIAGHRSRKVSLRTHAATLALFLLASACSLPLPTEFNDSFDLTASAGTTGQGYRIRVFSPGVESPAPGAPVLFALDGDLEHDAVVGELRDAWRAGSIDPILLVSIGYGADLSTVTRLRQVDYAPPVAGSPDGRVDKFLEFVVNELKPSIQERYFGGAAISPLQAALGGHSLGGLAVLCALLSDPVRAQVRGFVALSPSVWYGNLACFERESALPPALPDPAEGAALYTAWGGAEAKSMAMTAAAMADRLRLPGRAGLALKAEEIPGAEHYGTILPGYAAGIAFLFPRGGR